LKVEILCIQQLGLDRDTASDQIIKVFKKLNLNASAQKSNNKALKVTKMDTVVLNLPFAELDQRQISILVMFDRFLSN
jgi:hypothetical protein